LLIIRQLGQHVIVKKKLLILLLFNSGLPADGSEEALANNS
jgi:hypothetical protein